MYPSGTLISVKSRTLGYNQIWQLFINNFPVIVRISSSLPTRTATQYESILFPIKFRYTNNNFYVMVLEIEIRGLAQFIGFEAIPVFRFCVVLNLDKLLEYFVYGQNVYFSMS